MVTVLTRIRGQHFPPKLW